MDSLRVLQTGALLRLRYQLIRQAWSVNPAWQKAGVYLTGLTLALFSLVLATGFFLLMQFLFHHRHTLQGIWELELGFMLVFLVMGIVWCFFPILLNLQSRELELELTKLVLYPLSAMQLHVVTVLLKALEPLSLFFYPWLLALVVAGGWELGLNSIGWMVLLVSIFGALHVVWGRLMVNLITIVFNSRRLREMLLLFSVLILIGLSLFPALISIEVERQQTLAAAWRGLSAYHLPAAWNQLLSLPLNLLNAFTPAGMAAQALKSILYGVTLDYGQAMAGLIGWWGLGHYLDWWLIKRLYTHPNRESRDTLGRRQFRIPPWLYRVWPPATWAIATKEIRYLWRSTLGKILFVLPLFIAVVFRILLIYEPWDFQRSGLAILSSLISYMFLTAMFLFSNAFGWDTEGFQTFVLSPVDLREVLLGKNVALAAFSCAEMCCLAYLYVVMFGFLSWNQWGQVMVFFGILLFGILSLGNIISLRFPSRVELNQGRYKQQGLPVLICLNIFSLLLSSPLWINLFAWWSGESPLLIGLGVLVCMAMTYHGLLPYATQLFEQQRLVILQKVTQTL